MEYGQIIMPTNMLKAYLDIYFNYISYSETINTFEMDPCKLTYQQIDIVK